MLHVKSLVKRYYPAQHDEIYGKSWLDNSPSQSLKVIRFSLSRSQWGFVENEKLLFWLHIYRAVSVLFYGIHFLALFVAIAYVILNL